VTLRPAQPVPAAGVDSFKHYRREQWQSKTK
jgi:hypothetical protein